MPEETCPVCGRTLQELPGTLHTGQTVEYHGSIEHVHGVWIYDGGCMCQWCFPPPHGLTRTGRHELDNPHTGAHLECVGRDSITAPT